MHKRILVTGGSGLVGSQFIGKQYHKIGSKHYNLINRKKDTFRSTTYIK